MLLVVPVDESDVGVVPPVGELVEPPVLVPVATPVVRPEGVEPVAGRVDEVAGAAVLLDPPLFLKPNTRPNVSAVAAARAARTAMPMIHLIRLDFLAGVLAAALTGCAGGRETGGCTGGCCLGA